MGKARLWFAAREHIILCLIVLAVLVLHLLILTNPPASVGDEHFYTSDAKSFLAGTGVERPEHPPLGIWFIAAGMFVFGDNAVGWRSFPIVFGIAAIFLFYFICRRLVRQESDGEAGGPSQPEKGLLVSTFVPVLATFLFAFENLSFVQSHIAMLDVFYVTFMLLGFLLYLRGSYPWAGAIMGLSMLSKPMGLLGVLAILMHWLVTRRSERLGIVKLVGFVVVVWFGLLALLEYPASQQWASPISRTWEMLTTHLSLKANVGTSSLTASPPWVWVTNPMSDAYYILPHYLTGVGWIQWSLILPSMTYVFYKAATSHRKTGVPRFVLSWFGGVWGLLIVLELVTNRKMFQYYFYPAIPAVCLAIAWGAWNVGNAAQRGARSKVAFLIGLGLLVVGTLVVFVIMSPYGTNMIGSLNINE